MFLYGVLWVGWVGGSLWLDALQCFCGSRSLCVDLESLQTLKTFSPSRIFQMSDFLFAKFTVLTDVATLFGDNFIWIHWMELR